MLAVIFLILTTTPVANATVVASYSAILESFAIVPASGSIAFSSSSMATGDVFLSDGCGGGEGIGYQAGPIVFIHASTDCSSVSSFADSISGTAFVASNFKAPPSEQFFLYTIAMAAPYSSGGGFHSSFSIIGTEGPVLVRFSAAIPYAQSVATTGSGIIESYIFFDVNVEGRDLLLAHSYLLSNPNMPLSKTGTFSLSNSIILTAGENYRIDVLLWGQADTGVTPEPASLGLLLAGILPPVILRRLRR